MTKIFTIPAKPKLFPLDKSVHHTDHDREIVISDKTALVLVLDASVGRNVYIPFQSIKEAKDAILDNYHDVKYAILDRQGNEHELVQMDFCYRGVGFKVKTFQPKWLKKAH